MPLNANIILAGKQPNILGALQQGTQAAAQTNEVRKQNALSQLFQEQGAGIRSGEANALNAYAQFDPAAALGIEQTHHGMGVADEQLALNRTKTNHSMSIANERLSLARAAGARAAEAHAASVDARTASADLEKMTQGLAGMQTAQTPEQWDALAQQFGTPELAGQFENKDALAAYYTAATEGLSAALSLGRGPKPLSPEGKLAADVQAGLLDPSQANPVDLEDVDKFRKEFTGVPAVKAFSEQRQAYGRVVASAQNPSPAGDMALIFNYMKILDPGSVVRESEFALAAQTGSYGERIKASVAQVANGEKLSDAMRADFVARSEALYRRAESDYRSIYNQFNDVATARNYPSGAMIDFGAGVTLPDVPEGPAGNSQQSYDFADPSQQQLYEKYAK